MVRFLSISVVPAACVLLAATMIRGGEAQTVLPPASQPAPLPHARTAQYSLLQPQVVQSTAAGAYTAEQATRGQKNYSASCGTCHLSAEHSDNTFKGLWDGRTVYDMVEVISTTMPQFDPGSLPRSEYLDIVSYILKLNGSPEGKSPLPSDEAALKRIKIEIAKR